MRLLILFFLMLVSMTSCSQRLYQDCEVKQPVEVDYGKCVVKEPMTEAYRLYEDSVRMEPNQDGIIYVYSGNYLADLVDHPYLSRQQQDSLVDMAINIFDTLDNVLFRKTDNIDSAHIKIYWSQETHIHDGKECYFPFDSTTLTLAHGYVPYNPDGHFHGHVHLYYRKFLDASISFLSVVLHEMGHVIGLSHSEIYEAVMYYAYTKEKKRLHEDDLAGLRVLYAGYVLPEKKEAPEDKCDILLQVLQKLINKLEN